MNIKLRIWGFPLRALGSHRRLVRGQGRREFEDVHLG